MNILEVDGAVERVGSGWIRSDMPWSYDHELAASLRELRRVESDQMLAWAALDGCRLRFLRTALDDDGADDCGRCDRCTDHTWQSTPDPALTAKAAALLRGGDVIIEPRRQWPTRLDEPKGKIAADSQCRPGRALARLGDGGWDAAVTALLAIARNGQPAPISDEMLRACADVLKRWDWEARPTWICPMPSRRSTGAIQAVADALGSIGNLPLYAALVAEPSELSPADRFQADQANSAHQVVNMWHRLAVDEATLPDSPTLVGPVLLIDDEIDSRWTMTVAAHRLRAAGSGPILPFALRAR